MPSRLVIVAARDNADLIGATLDALADAFPDAELWVDTQTWERARSLLEEASALVHDGARPPRTEGTELVNLSLFAFVMDAP